MNNSFKSNRQASKAKPAKTGKHTAKPVAKAASISKHAQILGKLGGRPPSA